MPITTSAKKALRQNKRRHARNLSVKKSLKETIKKYRKFVSTNKDEAQKFLGNVYAQLDKAAKNEVIKKNTASRLKSRLSHLLVKK